MTYLDVNRSNIFLYFTAIIVQLSSFNAGVTYVWSTSTSPKLESLTENPLGTPLTVDEVSWLASLVCLGSAAGALVSAYLADTIGRKRTLLLSTVLVLISYAVLAFGQNIYLYYLARFIGGICIGLYLSVVPTYIGEIAQVHNRGALGGLLGVLLSFGNLYSFAVGPYISIRDYSLTCMVFPIIFLIICIPFIPETPCYLIMIGRSEDARKTLSKFRSSNIESELVELIAMVKESLAEKMGITDLFRTKNLRRGLILTIGLMLTQQLTAVSAIYFYMQSIFENAGSNISKEIATIIMGIIAIIGTFLSSSIVDRFGRKSLLLISSIISCICLLILSIYFYLFITIDVSQIAWLPLIVLVLYMFFYNLGAGPLPYVVLGEIFPPSVKSAASSTTVACCFLFAFAVAKVFPILVNLVESWFAFLVFGILNAVMVIFIWCRMPETKGKTLREIQEILK